MKRRNERGVRSGFNVLLFTVAPVAPPLREVERAVRLLILSIRLILYPLCKRLCRFRRPSPSVGIDRQNAVQMDDKTRSHLKLPLHGGDAKEKKTTLLFVRVTDWLHRRVDDMMETFHFFRFFFFFFKQEEKKGPVSN